MKRIERAYGLSLPELSAPWIVRALSSCLPMLLFVDRALAPRSCGGVGGFPPLSAFGGDRRGGPLPAPLPGLVLAIGLVN